MSYPSGSALEIIDILTKLLILYLLIYLECDWLYLVGVSFGVLPKKVFFSILSGFLFYFLEGMESLALELLCTIPTTSEHPQLTCNLLFSTKYGF